MASSIVSTMASSQTLKLACVVLLCMTLSATLAQAITCDQVSTSLAPCMDYVTGSETLAPGCCTGITSLNAAAKTTADRQTVCNCLKSIATSIGAGINFAAAAELPRECGVDISVSISANTDCSN